MPNQSSQDRYVLAEYDSEEERARDPKGPPLENQSSAAAYIGTKIQGARGVYALMGGFALVLLGSSRTTRDVDLVTDLTMKQVWSVIEGDPRLVVPTSRIAADVIKIFVKTGPGYDGCTLRKNVEVDIALPGVKGTPRDISQATTNVRGGQITIDGQPKQPLLTSLAVPYVLRAKMYHYADRAYDRDMTDITFLLKTYGSVISQNNRLLKRDDVVEFLDSKRLSEQEKIRYASILGVKLSR